MHDLIKQWIESYERDEYKHTRHDAYYLLGRIDQARSDGKLDKKEYCELSGYVCREMINKPAVYK